MYARHRVLQSHIDAGERHAYQPLCPEQAKERCELLFDSRGSQFFAFDQWCQVLNEISRWFKCRRPVGEYDAVPQHHAST